MFIISQRRRPGVAVHGLSVTLFSLSLFGDIERRFPNRAKRQDVEM